MRDPASRAGAFAAVAGIHSRPQVSAVGACGKASARAPAAWRRQRVANRSARLSCGAQPSGLRWPVPLTPAGKTHLRGAGRRQAGAPLRHPSRTLAPTKRFADSRVSAGFEGPAPAIPDGCLGVAVGTCGEPCEQADQGRTTNVPQGPKSTWGDVVGPRVPPTAPWRHVCPARRAVRCTSPPPRRCRLSLASGAAQSGR